LDSLQTDVTAQQDSFGAALQALESQLGLAFDKFVHLGSDLEASRSKIEQQEEQLSQLFEQKRRAELKVHRLLVAVQKITCISPINISSLIRFNAAVTCI
jgi:septal ring factor EnvC (AmiA/AmiB activator)